MKRYRLPIRLSWRNPDMPVLRLNEQRKMIEVPPNWIRRYYEQKMENPNYNAPHYKDDPTYNLRKRK